MDEILEKYIDRSYLIEAVHDILDSRDRKSLSDDEIKRLARHFRVNTAEVLGILTFYTMFPLKVSVKHTISVCVSTVCGLKDSKRLVEFLKGYLGCDDNNVSSDGVFLVKEVECLGLCDIAPAIMVDNRVYGNLTVEKLKKVIEDNR